MNGGQRSVFADGLGWRTCRHRRIRQRPMPVQTKEMPHEEYCDLTADEEKAINQWCRMDNCPYLDRPDVP